jgi:regulatory protein
LDYAFELALGFLAYRPRSEREVRERLDKKSVPAAVVDRVVERLRALRLLDDRQFASYWVEQRQTHRPRGARLLRLELQRKGIGADVIAEALEQLVQAEDPIEAALRAGERKARGLRSLSEADFQSKLGQFLLRRGFDYRTAGKVTRRLWSEARSGPPAEP